MHDLQIYQSDSILNLLVSMFAVKSQNSLVLFKRILVKAYFVTVWYHQGVGNFIQTCNSN